MRTRPLALLGAAGIVSTLLLAGLPAAQACSLLGAPTACATAVYDSLKDNANKKVAQLQVWGQAEAQAASACPPAEVGVPLPVVDSSPLGLFVEQMQAELARFQQGSSGNVFPAAGYLVGDSWFHAVDLAMTYDKEVTPLLVEVTPNPANLTLPDTSSATALEGQGLAAALGAQETGLAVTACVQALPSPPL